MSLDETRRLLDRVRRGDREALEDLLARHGDRLRRMIRLRLHPRLKPRVDEDDVIQEVLLEAARRLERYLEDPRMPFFVWLRFLTAQRMAALVRHHLGVKARDARREVRIDRAPLPGESRVVLAEGLAGRFTSPTQGAVRGETKRKIADALDRMEENDREILALRHFEQLSNVEAAHELGVDVSAASKRYGRALTRLKQLLE